MRNAYIEVLSHNHSMEMVMYTSFGGMVTLCVCVNAPNLRKEAVS